MVLTYKDQMAIRKGQQSFADVNVAEISFDKLYQTVVIDPPWQIQKILRKSHPNQVEMGYEMMSLENIKKIQLPLADNAFVFLWTIEKYLRDSYNIIDAWGLKHICVMVWHKNQNSFPMPNRPLQNCEFIIFAKRGQPKMPHVKGFFTCFSADTRGHLIKPDEFYDMIRPITPEPRLDMFARRDIAGFDRWGD